MSRRKVFKKYNIDEAFIKTCFHYFATFFVEGNYGCNGTIGRDEFYLILRN